jgi:hypothetical protein
VTWVKTTKAAVLDKMSEIISDGGSITTKGRNGEMTYYAEQGRKFRVTNQEGMTFYWEWKKG